MKEEQLKKLLKDAQDWAESDIGEKALEQAVNDAKNMALKLEEARQINPEELHRHFTL